MSEIHRLGEKRWLHLVELIPELQQLSPMQQQQGQQRLSLSDFIFEQSCRHPQWFSSLFTADLEQRIDEQLQLPLWQQMLAPLNENAAKAWLRQQRNRIMLAIAWLELGDEITVEQSVSWLSKLADTAIIASLHWLREQQRPLYGLPVDPSGNPVELVVLGMGKLGGHELNFSSDIDLIFCYRENGETTGGRRSVANQQYFIRQGQQLIQLLSQSTVDGFVFRVDMRLRPFGESGPLAVSFTAIEDYYQNHGRDWERYAMVKARAIGASVSDQEILKQLLTPFVYRRYIDFSVLESLRRMKALIRAEVRRKQRFDNIKLGFGGIREAEFIVQALQLIRGGREPKLRKTSFLLALTALTDDQQLESSQADELRHSYLRLRRVENILQEINDSQTQELPQDPLDQQRVAQALGLDSWPAAVAMIEATQQQVGAIFDGVIGREGCGQPQPQSCYQLLWQQLAAEGELRSDCGFSETFCQMLRRLEQDSRRRIVGDQGRETFEQLMPVVLELLAEYPDPEPLAARVFAIFEAILSRSVYLQLLLENRGALLQLLRLCERSPRLSEQLKNYPLLLDELLDPQVLFQPIEQSEYPALLQQFMLRIEPDDLEQQLEALRQFKQTQMLHIAASDIVGALPLMKVSDHLTALAEALTVKVVQLAWQQMVARYGYPDGITCESSRLGFAVVAYGKLGGIELGYGSDLDLVFIHDCESYAPTSGPKEIDSKQFYLRLAQRIMHLFQTRTSSGILYEVDMRLRPSGNAGLLVSSITAYEQYQQQQAWTWEHQALVRSRVIFADPTLQKQFLAVRQKVLAKPRKLRQLAEEVRSMRQKMQQHLDRSDSEHLDLKQARGGMVDIEFLAQYLVLAYAAQQPSMTRWSDNVRIFEAATAAGLLSEPQRELLVSTYLDIRNEVHRQALQCHDRVVARKQLGALAEQIQKVGELWEQLLPPDGEV